MKLKSKTHQIFLYFYLCYGMFVGLILLLLGLFALCNCGGIVEVLFDIYLCFVGVFIAKEIIKSYSRYSKWNHI